MTPPNFSPEQRQVLRAIFLPLHLLAEAVLALCGSKPKPDKPRRPTGYKWEGPHGQVYVRHYVYDEPTE